MNADKRPLISVIIPAHNEERYIAESLRAVLSQDYSNIEVIVVDNNSTDRTSEVARSFPGVRVVHESNKGTMWACERGRKEARGEIIVRMDADCLPDKDWLSRGAGLLDDTGVVIASGPYDYYDGSAWFRIAAWLIYRCVYIPAHWMMGALGRGGISMGGNTFLRATTLAEAGGFNTSIIFYGDDTELPRRLSAYGRCVFSTNITSRSSARRFKKQGVSLILVYIFHFLKQTIAK